MLHVCTTFEYRDVHHLQMYFEITHFYHAYTIFICQKTESIIDAFYG